MKPNSASPGATETFDVHRYLSVRKQLVDTHLDWVLPPPDRRPGILHEAMRYSVFAGGKRIRPILAIATVEALGCEPEVVLDFACALEMIHTYSLVHDDLPAMDNDDYRRGHLTCHKKFGEAIAILAGNGLMTLAFELLSRSANAKVAPSVQVEVINRLCRAIGPEDGVIAGQVVDVITEGKPFTADELDYIHASKTGALIEASISCPALLCGASPATLAALRTFGLKIGLAFQIVDDILDIVGDPAELGKTSGKDKAEQKATYPALYGLDASRAAAHRLVDVAVTAIQCLGEKGLPLVELAHFISVRRF